ncbi:Oidioi.mRNA.OKI2018_I69.chr1.g3922.t2.cds [Oikopleura dioica]|uniref:Phosphoinositide phospholipase C n=1 Tax=Oikopleura dioica TaxID=34765 RepID=A0ABN7SZ70_OIKDI|nr:Oidioi.mRNA.OKI2018_I69.chr1.g3922.t2.cds [Oikopleura dioica]
MASMLNSENRDGKQHPYSAEDLDRIMTDKTRIFKKVRENWQKDRKMVLWDDRLSIWMSTKGTDLTRARKISVEDIEEVSLGTHSDIVWEKAKKKIAFQSDQAFTISFKLATRMAPLYLIAEDSQTARAWVEGLSRIRDRVSRMTSRQRHTWWLWEKFKAADKDGNGTLTKSEVKSFFNSINLSMNPANFEKLFKKYDDNKSNSLSWGNVKELYEELLIPNEVRNLYYQIAGEDETLQLCEFREFLEKYQFHKNLTDEKLKEMVRVFEPTATESNLEDPNFEIGLYGFAMYIRSAKVIDDSSYEKMQDMSRPMTDYWIASSHNTYLLDDQLTGPSSTEAYKSALLKGCRCVELDCWDGANGEPIIYHGWTRTSKISFKDVITTVRQYAFKKSDYPVCLSLENHCHIPQQQKMAKYMVEILGDLLLRAPVDPDEDCLPSPEAMKGKIWIKGKKLKEAAGDSKKNKAENDDFVVDDEVSEEDEGEGYAQGKDRDSPVGNGSIPAAEEAGNQKKQKKTKKIKLHKDLSDLVIYTQSRHLKDFDDAQQNSDYRHISSIDDKVCSSYAKNQSKIDSSNYNPIPVWAYGCQIVALNYQTACEEMLINQARFKQNQGAGYVLKPEFLREDALRNNNFDINDTSTFPRSQPFSYKIKIISGCQLPKPKQSNKGEVVDPYVKIRVVGPPVDDNPKNSRTTKFIDNNGFSPCWNEEFTLTTWFPELSMLEILVYDKDVGTKDDKLANSYLPMDSIVPGYRQIPLFDKEGGSLYPATLFFHIEISE